MTSGIALTNKKHASCALRAATQH